MTRILECFDSELVGRVSAALEAAGLRFSLGQTNVDALSGWRIEVSDNDSAAGTAVVEKVAQALESERSPMRCNRCGSGMLPVDSSIEDAGDEPLFMAYRCPRCGTEGLTSIA